MTAETPGTPLTPEEEADLRTHWTGYHNSNPEFPCVECFGWHTVSRLLATLDRERRERVDPDLRGALRELVIDATHDGRGRLDSDEPDMYQPDIDANLARLDAILAATEAPRDHEHLPCGEWFASAAEIEAHEPECAATPDHTEGGEEPT